MVDLRILHTSDWHLGKSIHGQSLDEDQEHAVSCIEEELRNGYRCLIIAGDVFDRAIPPTTALELLSGFLERVSSKGIEVVIIPGNHDSPERLGFASGILGSRGVHIRCRYEECIYPIVLDDEVQIFALPFVEDQVVRSLYPDSSMTDHASAVGHLVSLMRERMVHGIPSILVAHEYAGRDLLRSESERELLLGDQGRIPAEVLSGFEYVALGHLHGPQTASRECKAHYSGSILQYSFSECDHEKGMISLRIEGGGVSMEKVPIVPRRRMTLIEDSFEKAVADPAYKVHEEDYVCIRLTDEGQLYDIQNRLKARFPNLLEVQMPNLVRDSDIDPETVRKALDSPRELFSLFLDRFNWKESEKETAIGIFDRARASVEGSRRRS